MAERFAIVTGASAGIGYELAEKCAREGFDLLIAADRPEITTAAETFRHLGVSVDALHVDLATTEGVDKLYAASSGRPVDALLANAGHGLGKGFLEQDFDDFELVVSDNANSDATPDILRRLGDTPRLKVIRQSAPVV